jgi:uroporphyrinogen decarboxylase
MPKSLEGILGEPGVRTNTPKEYIKVHEILGLDLIAAFPAPFGGGESSESSTSAEKKDEIVDEWGIKWRIIDGMPWYLEGTVKTVEDIKSLHAPDPGDEGPYMTAKEIIRLVREELAVGAVVEGPFSRSWFPMGFETYVKMLYTEPDVIRGLIEMVTEYFTEQGKTFIDHGVDVIWMPDDLAMVDGPFLSPASFRKFIFPYMKKMVDAFHKKGAKVLIHTDGQIMPIIEDLIETGFDGVHPIERKAGMSLKLVKEKYGDDLTFIGNVNAKTVLQQGPKEAIKEQVIECLKTAARGGGYILASDHSIHEGIPSDNVKFMFKTAKQLGKYPIK